MLFIVGLGLGDERDITLRGLDAVQRCSAARTPRGSCAASGTGTLRGLTPCPRAAAQVYLEAYTSVLGVDVAALARSRRGSALPLAPLLTLAPAPGGALRQARHAGRPALRRAGAPCVVGGRGTCASASLHCCIPLQGVDAILDQALTADVAFLVVGDPFAATTHTDLQLRARRAFHAIFPIFPIPLSPFPPARPGAWAWTYAWCTMRPS